MNYRVFTIIILILIFAPLNEVYACTSFAVYSKQVFYGMNFDYANLPLKFIISTKGDIRTFHLAFERPFGDVKFFVNTAGMNDRGLFASCQELHPEDEKPREKTDNNLFTFELYDAVATCKSVAEIKSIGEKKPLIDMPGVRLHNLFADPLGGAIVTEATESDTAIMEKQGSFLVMTNFPNLSLVGKNYKEAQGKGDERYIICHEYLKEHASDFTIDKGFQLLELSKNKDPEYPTTCSMVFDPKKQEVFIALERNFDKILKLSIPNATIETVKGFESEIKLTIPIGPEGLLIKDIMQAL